MAKDPSQPKSNDLARDVDRLLRQLPFGDPMLRGDGAPASRAPSARSGSTNGAPSGGASASVAAGGVLTTGHAADVARRRPAMSSARRGQAEPSALAQRISAWLRAILAVTLAAAVTVWPYASACGWMLSLALLVTATVLVAGVWASAWTWRLRVPAAHVLSVGVIVWGLVLAAEQVLPRVGYAAVTATWTCVAR